MLELLLAKQGLWEARVKKRHEAFIQAGRQYAQRCWAFTGITNYLGKAPTDMDELLLKDKQAMERAYKEIEKQFFRERQ